MTWLDERTLMIARTLREPTFSRGEYERRLRWVRSSRRVWPSRAYLLGRREESRLPASHHGSDWQEVRQADRARVCGQAWRGDYVVLPVRLRADGSLRRQQPGPWRHAILRLPPTKEGRLASCRLARVTRSCTTTST